MTITKKLLVIAALGILVVVVGLAILGFFVPAEREFTNEIDIDAPANQVWHVITDQRRYTEWQTQLERVEMVSEKEWIVEPVVFN
jgi:uncharacterized membrane protein